MTGAASRVLQRVIPDRAAGFVFEVIPRDGGKDLFEISDGVGGPVIKGSSVRALLSGANWYLKYFCNAHVSWTGDQLRLPAQLPKVGRTVRIVSPYEFVNMYNYCTFNYTMSFWGWEEWERELDFLALNGVNLVLSVVGQEAVWQNVMRRMGMSEKEIFDFIPGPAFQAWWLMGNLEGWGGPVSQEWIDQQAALQKKILARTRELGMEPIMQGFYGMAPRVMIEKFPDARIYETGLWCAFNRPAMVDPTDPFFGKIAEVWYDELEKLYGDAKFYGGDPFHEGGSADIDLKDAGEKIQAAMLASHPGSTWVLQGWQSNPRKELLDGTISDNTLVLDLFGETNPQWNRRDGFYGHPWVWNIISNFGGNTGVHGSLWKVAEHPVEALNSEKKGRLVGLGAMMEGSMQDAVLWDLLFDMAWRSESPNLDDWVKKYADRRYGGATDSQKEAWVTLKNTAYNAKDGSGAEPESPMCARPSFDLTRAWGTMEREYDECEFARAWNLLIKDAEKYRGVGTYEHDLVNVSRQALANLSLEYTRIFSKAYHENNEEVFTRYTNAFLELILDQDRLLSTDELFMLGKWIADARKVATSEKESDLFEWNARTQVTTWGPKKSARNLHGYANREWAGLLKGFYYKRWGLFFKVVSSDLSKYSKKARSGKVQLSAITGGDDRATGLDPTSIEWFELEEKWTNMLDEYDAAPVGDPVDESLRVYKKYSPEISGICKTE